MARLSPSRACEILHRADAHGQDFHALTSRQVDVLLEHAQGEKYRKPKNAPGSKARMFFQHLQRRCGPRGSWP